jgi:hypothetical protein
MERLDPGTRLPAYDCPGGEELLLLAGDLADEGATYRAQSWMRSPPGSRPGLTSETGALYWVKRGHLTAG